MKNLKLLFGFLLVVAFVGGLYSQDAIMLGGPGYSEMVGDSCAGTGSIKYDNNTFENGYGWNTTVTDGRHVLKFTPPSYPWSFNKVCIAVTRTAAGSANFTFDVVFYDTTGAGGAPGANPVYTLANQTITTIPIYPLYAWYNFAVTPPPLANGSYYVGWKYNPAGANQSAKFIMADENSPAVRPGYGWANTGPWTLMSTYFPLYKAFGIRTEGSGGGPPSGTIGTICRNGINVAVPDNNPAGARDTIKMLGNVTPCSLLDVNVKIDTFPHTWISDMQFSLTHNGATPVNLFLNRGGSGDNIIGCTFNDSAANPISAGTPPFTGSFRPEQPLTAYNTQAPSGNWVVFMVDQFAGDLGFLKAWCIQFIFTCPTGGVTTIEVPFSYTLGQNYPNPFNPTTTIKYGLPQYGQTSLVVYDVLGRVVKTLVNEFKDAGSYSVTFDASSLSSGIYFYTLESGTYKETKRMLLVK
jgi:hypothetical protein